MASATASTTPERRGRRRASLVWRILAVNLFALAMLAGGILYLDSYQGRLIDARRAEVARQAGLIAAALGEVAATNPARFGPLARTLAARANVGLIHAVDGLGPVAQEIVEPPFTPRDPADEPVRRRVALAIDRAIDWLVGAPPVPPWPPDARATMRAENDAIVPGDALWRSDDGALVVTATEGVPSRGASIPLGYVHLTADARDITYRVRDERLRAFRLFLSVLALTTLLSVFLARTIAQPLDRLAAAAQRVKSGRAREVVVPRLPARRDEIGRLARAISDMTGALRQRIDATEAFAADVAHELKNPLASLRSAVETLGRVEDPTLQRELVELMQADIARLDRLITDIADASRLDAELSRAAFERVDVAALLADIARHARPPGATRLMCRECETPAMVLGDPSRLGQVARNLIDNALSFTADGGEVTLAVARPPGSVLVTVEDNGPGIPPDALDRVFERFYGLRAEGFGRHSGLGLAIARAIVEAHGGSIEASNRAEGGARFTVRLPAAP